jgi:hypothetical protein
MNEQEKFRFAAIKRTMQYGVTAKDLAWLIRLIETLSARRDQPKDEQLELTSQK